MNKLKSFHKGDSYSFSFIENNYDASYVCTISFIKDEIKYNYIATYADEKFTCDIDATTSNTMEDGEYRIFACFTKDTFKKTEYVSDVEVLKNITETAGIVVETYNKKMLRLIEARIAGRLEEDYDSYTIGNRSIAKMKPESLMKWREYFRNLVDQEEGYVNGKNTRNKIIMRYVGRYRDHQF